MSCENYSVRDTVKLHNEIKPRFLNPIFRYDKELGLVGSFPPFEVFQERILPSLIERVSSGASIERFMRVKSRIFLHASTKGVVVKTFHGPGNEHFVLGIWPGKATSKEGKRKSRDGTLLVLLDEEQIKQLGGG